MDFSGSHLIFQAFIFENYHYNLIVFIKNIKNLEDRQKTFGSNSAITLSPGTGNPGGITVI